MILEKEKITSMETKTGLLRGTRGLIVKANVSERAYLVLVESMRKLPGVPHINHMDLDIPDDGTITFIEPDNFDSWEDNQRHLFRALMARCEKAYMMLIATGLRPWEAYPILPSQIKYSITIDGTFKEWRNFFEMLYSPAVDSFFDPVRQFLRKGFKRYFGKVLDKND